MSDWMLIATPVVVFALYFLALALTPYKPTGEDWD